MAPAVLPPDQAPLLPPVAALGGLGDQALQQLPGDVPGVQGEYIVDPAMATATYTKEQEFNSMMLKIGLLHPNSKQQQAILDKKQSIQKPSYIPLGWMLKPEQTAIQEDPTIVLGWILMAEQTHTPGWILMIDMRAIHDDPSIPLGWILMAEQMATQDDPSIPLGLILMAEQMATQDDPSVPLGWILMAEKMAAQDDPGIPLGWILMAEQMATQDDPRRSLSRIRASYNDGRPHHHEHQQLHHYPLCLGSQVTEFMSNDKPDTACIIPRTRFFWIPSRTKQLPQLQVPTLLARINPDQEQGHLKPHDEVTGATLTWVDGIVPVNQVDVHTGNVFQNTVVFSMAGNVFQNTIRDLQPQCLPIVVLQKVGLQILKEVDKEMSNPEEHQGTHLHHDELFQSVIVRSSHSSQHGSIEDQLSLEDNIPQTDASVMMGLNDEKHQGTHLHHVEHLWKVSIRDRGTHYDEEKEVQQESNENDPKPEKKEVTELGSKYEKPQATHLLHGKLPERIGVRNRQPLQVERCVEQYGQERVVPQTDVETRGWHASEVDSVLSHEKSMGSHKGCATHLSMNRKAADGLIWGAPLVVDRSTIESEKQETCSIAEICPNFHKIFSEKQHVADCALPVQGLLLNGSLKTSTSIKGQVILYQPLPYSGIQVIMMVAKCFTLSISLVSITFRVLSYNTTSINLVNKMTPDMTDNGTHQNVDPVQQTAHHHRHHLGDTRPTCPASSQDFSHHDGQRGVRSVEPPPAWHSKIQHYQHRGINPSGKVKSISMIQDDGWINLTKFLSIAEVSPSEMSAVSSSTAVTSNPLSSPRTEASSSQIFLRVATMSTALPDMGRADQEHQFWHHQVSQDGEADCGLRLVQHRPGQIYNSQKIKQASHAPSGIEYWHNCSRLTLQHQREDDDWLDRQDPCHYDDDAAPPAHSAHAQHVTPINHLLGEQERQHWEAHEEQQAIHYGPGRDHGHLILSQAQQRKADQVCLHKEPVGDVQLLHHQLLHCGVQQQGTGQVSQPDGGKLITVPPGKQDEETVPAEYGQAELDGQGTFPAGSIYQGVGKILTSTAVHPDRMRKVVEELENLLERKEVRLGVETVEAVADYGDHDQHSHQGRVHFLCQQVNRHKSPPLQDGSCKVNQRDQVNKLNNLPKDGSATPQFLQQASSKFCLEVHRPDQELLLQDHCLRQESRIGLKRMESKANKMLIDLESVPALAQIFSRLLKSTTHSWISSLATWLGSPMYGSASAGKHTLSFLTKITESPAEVTHNKLEELHPQHGFHKEHTNQHCWQPDKGTLVGDTTDRSDLERNIGDAEVPVGWKIVTQDIEVEDLMPENSAELRAEDSTNRALCGARSGRKVGVQTDLNVVKNTISTGASWEINQFLKAEYGPHSLDSHQPHDQHPQHPQHPQRRVYLQVQVLTNCENMDTAYHYLGSNEVIRDGGSLVSPLLCLHLQQDDGGQAKPVPGPQNQQIWGATHKERNRFDKPHRDELDTGTDITGKSNNSGINKTKLKEHDLQYEPSIRSTHARPANPLIERVMISKASGDLARCQAESQLSGFNNVLQTHRDVSEEGAQGRQETGDAQGWQEHLQHQPSTVCLHHQTQVQQNQCEKNSGIGFPLAFLHQDCCHQATSHCHLQVQHIQVDAQNEEGHPMEPLSQNMHHATAHLAQSQSHTLREVLQPGTKGIKQRNVRGGRNDQSHQQKSNHVLLIMAANHPGIITGFQEDSTMIGAIFAVHMFISSDMATKSVPLDHIPQPSQQGLQVHLHFQAFGHVQLDGGYQVLSDQQVHHQIKEPLLPYISAYRLDKSSWNRAAAGTDMMVIISVYYGAQLSMLYTNSRGQSGGRLDAVQIQWMIKSTRFENKQRMVLWDEKVRIITEVGTHTCKVEFIKVISDNDNQPVLALTLTERCTPLTNTDVRRMATVVHIQEGEDNTSGGPSEGTERSAVQLCQVVLGRDDADSESELSYNSMKSKVTEIITYSVPAVAMTIAAEMHLSGHVQVGSNIAVRMMEKGAALPKVPWEGDVIDEGRRQQSRKSWISSTKVMKNQYKLPGTAITLFSHDLAQDGSCGREIQDVLEGDPWQEDAQEVEEEVPKGRQYSCTGSSRPDWVVACQGAMGLYTAVLPQPGLASTVQLSIVLQAGPILQEMCTLLSCSSLKHTAFRLCSSFVLDQANVCRIHRSDRNSMKLSRVKTMTSSE